MMGGSTPDGIIPRLNSMLFAEVQVRVDLLMYFDGLLLLTSL